MSGKGSRQRPAAVPREVADANWSRIFQNVPRRVTFSGGPLHGTMQTLPDTADELAFRDVRGAPLYRRDPECPTRFVYHGPAGQEGAA